MVTALMRHKSMAALLLGCVVFEMGQATARAEEEQGMTIRAGRALYEHHCARCHGVDGTGGGPDAKRIFPKPRDLTAGVYKFRSTESGTPPTDDDFFRVISRGLPGSAMPAFGELSDAERQQLVAYIKNLSPVFTEQAPQPVTLAPDPGMGRADLTKGRQLYKTLGCAACHGDLGRGDGPSAKALVDDWGSPIRPANLTQGWTYRGGADPHSILLRLLTGIDGAGMPSYAEALSAVPSGTGQAGVSPEDAWHLAYYVASLQEEPAWKTTINAKAATGPLPASVADPSWDAVERIDVSLGSTVYRNGAVVPTMVNAVSVQAIYSGQGLALRLIWNDPTEDRLPPASAAQAGGAPPDALGLAFRPDGAGPEAGSLRTWPLADSPVLEVVYWSADAGEIRRGIAVGFSPVAARQAAVDILSGEAVYEDGRWTLLIRRPLNADRPVPMAIAVWDGGNQEQRKVRASSGWLDLVLPE